MKNKPSPRFTVSPYETFEQFLSVVKSKYGDKVLFRTKRRKTESAVTYNQFYDDVQKLALHYSKTYGARNKIAVIGENSYEWILTYFAVVCSNNIIVPIDKELSAPDISERYATRVDLSSPTPAIKQARSPT
jgi:long-chain acyl-CoA synthetase